MKPLCVEVLAQTRGTYMATGAWDIYRINNRIVKNYTQLNTKGKYDSFVFYIVCNRKTITKHYISRCVQSIRTVYPGPELLL